MVLHDDDISIETYGPSTFFWQDHKLVGGITKTADGVHIFKTKFGMQSVFLSTAIWDKMAKVP